MHHFKSVCHLLQSKPNEDIYFFQAECIFTFKIFCVIISGGLIANCRSQVAFSGCGIIKAILCAHQLAFNAKFH